MSIYITYSKSRTKLKQEIYKDQLLVNKGGKIEDLPGSTPHIQLREVETGVFLPESMESVECLDDNFATANLKISSGLGTGNVDLPNPDEVQVVADYREQLRSYEKHRRERMLNIQVSPIYFSGGDSLRLTHSEDDLPHSVYLPGGLDESRIQGSTGKDEDRERRRKNERNYLSRRGRVFYER